MPFRVFVSYSTRDLQTATALHTWIAAAGAHVYLAEYSLAPGRPIAAELDANIRACDLFVLLWSQNARTSDWVPQEIGIATATRREIMPVVLHEGLTPPAFLSSLKYLELYKDPQAVANWLHRFVFGEGSGPTAA